MTPNDRGLLDAGHPEAIDLMGARMLVVARMGASKDDTVLIRSRIGGEPRMVLRHAHADVECFYVLEGRLDVNLAGDAPSWRTIGPGLRRARPHRRPA